MFKFKKKFVVSLIALSFAGCLNFSTFAMESSTELGGTGGLEEKQKPTGEFNVDDFYDDSSGNIGLKKKKYGWFDLDFIWEVSPCEYYYYDHSGRVTVAKFKISLKNKTQNDLKRFQEHLCKRGVKEIFAIVPTQKRSNIKEFSKEAYKLEGSKDFCSGKLVPKLKDYSGMFFECYIPLKDCTHYYDWKNKGETFAWKDIEEKIKKVMKNTKLCLKFGDGSEEIMQLIRINFNFKDKKFEHSMLDPINPKLYYPIKGAIQVDLKVDAIAYPPDVDLQSGRIKGAKFRILLNCKTLAEEEELFYFVHKKGYKKLYADMVGLENLAKKPVCVSLKGSEDFCSGNQISKGEPYKGMYFDCYIPLNKYEDVNDFLGKINAFTSKIKIYGWGAKGYRCRDVIDVGKKHIHVHLDECSSCEKFFGRFLFDSSSK